MADMDISLRRVIVTAVNVEDAITARDAAIFDARAAGQSLRAIADAAGVSHETVRSIVAAERARRTPPFTPNSTPLGPDLGWMTREPNSTPLGPNLSWMTREPNSTPLGPDLGWMTRDEEIAEPPVAAYDETGKPPVTVINGQRMVPQVFTINGRPCLATGRMVPADES